ncbi:MAG: hypothetical protein NZ899_07630 [Thermoguttaceae bacterium]|nr:hypothetical protein [Thermoguttaceae bacterium]MDW8079013.1 hypothetical protein [Thermoguttaceae bacterium]
MLRNLLVLCAVLFTTDRRDEGVAGQVEISVAPEGRVVFSWGKDLLISSPPEGLWSVATDWQDNWPSNWQHARVETVEKLDDWMIVHGRLGLPEGRLILRDAYRPERGIVRCLRRFRWDGTKPLTKCTLSVRWLVPGAKAARPLLPGILYYGNPSGARTAFGAVAIHRGLPGEESIFEEHRFAAPFVSIEWSTGSQYQSAALHTLPSPVPGGNQADQWWSLGLIGLEDATELVALSGPCAANGRRSVVKALQKGFMNYPDTWMTLPPGAIVEKTFFLEAHPDVPRGSGFRAALRTALKLHNPFCTQGLPTVGEIIQAKYRFARSRFRDREEDPGFEKYPDELPGTHYVMGWAGQSEAFAAPLLLLTKELDDPQAPRLAVRAMNHLATAPFNEQGFLVRYHAESRQWSHQDPVSQAQAMENFARAIMAAGTVGNVDRSSWEKFLFNASALHSQRILEPQWRPESTAEAFFVSPLLKAYKLFGQDTFREAALKAANHYAERHLDMTEPYWGGTLDARCEDKEGAWAAFQAFLAAFEVTGERKYLDWAAHAMDVVLTYTVLWDIDLPPGRLRDHGFKTRGWTIVSAQNQHLDVFGVLIAPAIWRMGDHLDRPELKRLAAVMFRSCGQLIDPWGSQGEQIQQTQFAQRGDLSDLRKFRGGYSEDWTVLWITAHFLAAAAEFKTMGVDLDRDL